MKIILNLFLLSVISFAATCSMASGIVDDTGQPQGEEPFLQRATAYNNFSQMKIKIGDLVTQNKNRAFLNSTPLEKVILTGRVWVFRNA